MPMAENVINLAERGIESCPEQDVTETIASNNKEKLVDLLDSDDVPRVSQGWAQEGSRYHNSTLLLFPSTSGVYIFSGEVIIPKNKSNMFCSEAPMGARIQQLHPEETSWTFVHDPDGPGEWRFLRFANLVFHKGGVKLVGPLNGRTEFSRCHFEAIGGYAISTERQSVVSGMVDQCTFSRCAGGIRIGEPNSDLWSIARSQFVRTINDVLISGNRFMGINRLPFRDTSEPTFGTEDELIQFLRQERSACHAIELNRGPMRMRVVANDFHMYAAELVKEEFTGAAERTHMRYRNNYWIANTVHHMYNLRVFSRSGGGFRQ
jgi:hypothetical protein